LAAAATAVAKNTGSNPERDLAYRRVPCAAVRGVGIGGMKSLKARCDLAGGATGTGRATVLRL